MNELTILLFLAHGLFIISLLTFVQSTENVFIMFILSELMLISGALNILIYSFHFQHAGGEATGVLIFALGAAGAAIGLITILNFVKLQNSLSLMR